MTSDHFDQVMMGYYNRRPFRPFTVALVNGDRFEVDHPTAVSFRNGFGIFVGPGSVIHFFDHESVAQFIGELMNAPGAAA